MAEGFFERWSRRKQAQGKDTGLPEAEPDIQADRKAQASPRPVASPDADVAGAASPAAASPVARGLGQATPTPRADPAIEPPQARPAPTLADTESLTLESDFKPFVGREVAPEVKNAAFRKLFADPHFNQMDGLDVYIDDYSVTTPLPLSVLRQMASAKFLELVADDDDPPGDAPLDRPEWSQKPSETPAPEAMAQSAPPENDPSPPTASIAESASQTLDDDHADLRLQPDHAPRAARARDGTG